MKFAIAMPRHIDDILNIYEPIVKGTHISFEYAVPTREEMQIRLEETLEFYPWIVAFSEKGLAGYAYASRFRKRKAYDRVCEVSVYVDQGQQRLGLGEKLYKIIFRILELQGITQCIAGISLPNPGSIRFHIRCGFKEIGTFKKIGFKFGQWYDVLFMQNALQQQSTGNKTKPWHEIDWNELEKLGLEK